MILWNIDMVRDGVGGVIRRYVGMINDKRKMMNNTG